MIQCRFSNEIINVKSRPSSIQATQEYREHYLRPESFVDIKFRENRKLNFHVLQFRNEFHRYNFRHDNE